MSGGQAVAGHGLRQIVIAGGGVPGWMAAAALARVLAGSACRICVVESERGHPSWLGYGTLPSLQSLHDLLGIGERDLVRAAGATIKLGTRFNHWGPPGSSYFHPYGPYGLGVEHRLFQSYWLEERSRGAATPLEEWSATALAAQQGRFGPFLAIDSANHFSLQHGYHVDARRYAGLLRQIAEAGGVLCMAGKVGRATVDEHGLIERLELEDGRVVDGDFFIDCTGAEGILARQALGGEYIDWSHWLPCDRVLVAGQVAEGESLAYTRADACVSGWTGRVSLQDYTSCGYVYSTRHSTEEQALRALQAALGSVPDEPVARRLAPGRLAQAWRGNCLAIGQAAGYVDEVESVDIHLVQTALGRLFSLFPERDTDLAVVTEYNRLTSLEIEQARDFAILHYAATKRDDSEFWRECRGMRLPEPLAYKREVFAATGYLPMYELETFAAQGWFSVLAGLQEWPSGGETVLDIYGYDNVRPRFEAMRTMLLAAVDALPSHGAYLRLLLAGS